MAAASGRRSRRPDKKHYVPKPKLCKFYQQGSCLKGVHCNFVHQNPNEAKGDEEELLFDSRSDFRFAVGHRESNLRKLKEATDDIPVRVSWPGAKLFLGGSPDQREKFKNIVHQCLGTKEIGFLSIPECISVHYIVGRQGKTLREVSEKTNTICMARCQGDKREIEIIAYTAEELDSAKEFLKAKLFTQTAVDGSILCFDTVSSTENLRITFRPYSRYTPINLRKLTVHEMCLVERRHTKALTGSEESTLVKGLQRLSLEQTDSGEACASDQTSRMPPRGYVDEENVLYFRQWTEHYLKKLETEAETLVPKFEARFGKVLWTDIPPDIARKDYSLLEFQQEDALRLKTAFATFTDSDLTGLTGDVPEPFEVESYDLKVVPRTKTAGNSRLATAERKIDLRVTVTDGHFNLVAAFGDEWKKSCADWIILDGKHDFRISIGARKILPLEDAFLQIVRTLHMEDGDCISYENTSELSVHYIRHKKKRCYPLEDYVLAVYDIREFDVDYRDGITTEARQTAHFKSQTPHCEIELQNRKWMAWFYAAAGHSLKSAMVAEQCLPPEDVSRFDQHWETESVLSDLPEFLEHVNSICEILTSSTA